ncbi:MAG TPA: hypothetical protein VJ813_13955 [Vicinamibacterales bacterium]|nr:hypothetical protein [Vicinamibacterales bacterium]
MQRAFWTSLLLAAAVVVGGCDNDVGNTPTEPAPTTTDTFTGTININGAMTHTFPIVAAGTVTATLTEVTPDATVAVGFALGTWNASASTCQQVIPNDAALQGLILTGNVAGAGTLCVRLYDPGSKLTGPVGYTVTVVHP